MYTLLLFLLIYFIYWPYMVRGCTRADPGLSPPVSIHPRNHKHLSANQRFGTTEQVCEYILFVLLSAHIPVLFEEVESWGPDGVC